MACYDFFNLSLCIHKFFLEEQCFCKCACVNLRLLNFKTLSQKGLFKYLIFYQRLPDGGLLDQDGFEYRLGLQTS